MTFVSPLSQFFRALSRETLENNFIVRQRKCNENNVFITSARERQLFYFSFLFLSQAVPRERKSIAAYCTRLRGVAAHRMSIVAIGQMRRKAGGVLQFASCLNAPSLPARNDRIVTVSNLLFAVRGNGDAPEGGKEKNKRRKKKLCARIAQNSRLSSSSFSDRKT